MTSQHPSQHWNAQTYADNARFVTDYGTSLIDWLAPQPQHRILDLGCGDGVLTRQIVASGATVMGVDGSADFVAAARAKGIDAVQADAHTLMFNAEFDAVFSNAALHWMTDADAVANNVFRGLKSGGRFVAEMGGHGNIACIRQALQQAATQHGWNTIPCWYFPSPAEYATVLEHAGFTVRRLCLYERPTPLPTGIEGWLKTFATPMLACLDAAQQSTIIATACATLKQQLPQDQGIYIADYVRLRFEAVKT